jgi:hypothetical protein
MVHPPADALREMWDRDASHSPAASMTGMIATGGELWSELRKVKM